MNHEKYDVNHKDSMPARTPMPPPVTPSNNQNNAGMFYMGSIIRYDANNVQNGLVGLLKIFFSVSLFNCFVVDRGSCFIKIIKSSQF